jgi:hypothetical protein
MKLQRNATQSVDLNIDKTSGVTVGSSDVRRDAFSPSNVQTTNSP